MITVLRSAADEWKVGMRLCAHPKRWAAGAPSTYSMTANSNRRKKHTEKQMKAMASAEKQLAETPGRKERLYRIIDNRNLCRMTPKGRPDKDGHQRYSYPDDYTPTATDIGRGARTITIPALIPEDRLMAKRGTSKNVKTKRQPLKTTQKYQYKSQMWSENYGLRSLVESSFNHLKQHNGEALDDPRKRSGRG